MNLHRRRVRLVGTLAATAVAVAATAGAQAAADAAVYSDPAFSPDGKTIAFVSRERPDQDSLWLMKADGSGVRRIPLPDGYGPRWPTWSPDGRRIAFGFGYDGIFVVNRDGSGFRRLVRSGCCAEWSPVGRWIAYVGFHSDGGRIVAVRPDGSATTLVAGPPHDKSYGSPTWSPDGGRLAFAVGGGVNSPGVDGYVGVVDSFRGRVRTLAWAFAPGGLDWSPDGRRIVFNDLTDIVVLDVRSGRTKILFAISGARPGWSPDGRRIVFSHEGAIHVMRADGSNVRRLFPRS